PTPPAPERTLSPPPATASAATVGAGAAAFGAYCGNCHGAGAISLGILPDLRYSERLRSADDWQSVVLDGILEAEGMASFAKALDAKTVEAIRAFVIAQANATAK